MKHPSWMKHPQRQKDNRMKWLLLTILPARYFPCTQERDGAKLYDTLKFHGFTLWRWEIDQTSFFK